MRECLQRNQPGRYQILAAINAVHTDAPTAADTDWTQIATLYEQLYAVTRRRSSRSTGRSRSPSSTAPRSAWRGRRCR